jgi:hypothetical protein
MYVFATVILLGLAIAKVVDLFTQSADLSRGVRTALSIVLGLVTAFVADYSPFAQWGIPLRAEWVHLVMTGLTIAGVAALWHEVLDFVGSYARRSNDEATEIESRMHRVA